MEKTIFLFRRAATRTMADFASHYINNHAVLGRRLVRCAVGYTVNIVDGDVGPDAITEHWVSSAMDLLTPLVAYDTLEDFQSVLADDRTLFSSFELYVADGEVEVLAGPPLPFVEGELTPEAKSITMFPDGAPLPPPFPRARRVVDSHIAYKLVFDGKGGTRKEHPDIAVIRMAWGSDPTSIEQEDSIAVKEYRQIEEPGPGWK